MHCAGFDLPTLAGQELPDISKRNAGGTVIIQRLLRYIQRQQSAQNEPSIKKC